MLERLQWIMRRRCTPSIQHPPALHVNHPGKFGSQASLPNALPTSEKGHPALVAGGGCPGGPEPRQLGRAADKWGADRFERLRQLRGRGRFDRPPEIQPGVLGEDGGVQPAEVGARVDTEFLDQNRPGPPVGQ